MLSYAFQTLKQENYDDVAVESFDEMYDLLAAILAKGIGIQLKQGLYREYINRQEELHVMRGKINMPGTIKNRLSHERVLTCDFDELSENNLPRRRSGGHSAWICPLGIITISGFIRPAEW